MSQQDAGIKAATSREAGVEPTKTRQLKVKTFGETSISFANVRLCKTNQSVDMVKRAGARRYRVKANGQGMVDITYEATDTFTLGLFNHSRWCTTIYVTPTRLLIGNVAKVEGDQVTTRYVKQKEARNVLTTFKIENQYDSLLKRLDVQGHDTQWFSVFSHNANLLMVRPNGDWLAEKLLYLTDQMATQAINNYRRSNGRDVLSSTNTVVARRLQASQTSTKSVQSQTEEGNSQAIRLLDDKERYQQQLQALEEDWQSLREKTGQYKGEWAEWKKVEEQWERLESDRKVRKEEIDRENRELDEARKVLNQRNKWLQEDLEELAEMEKRRDDEKQKKEAHEKRLQQEADYATWSRKKFTVRTLSERFTREKRVVTENDKIEITNEPTKKLKQPTIATYMNAKGKQAESQDPPAQTN